MKLTIEIAAAALLVVCVSASGAAFAAGKAGKSADGLSCSFSVAKNASPAARCAAIRRQCGGKFYANYCGAAAVGDVRRWIRLSLCSFLRRDGCKATSEQIKNTLASL